MKLGVSLSIDVTKIDKEKLITGKKGKYLDAQVFIEVGQADQYGNHGMITQAVSKEARDNGERGAILGNCKIFWNDSSNSQPTKQPVEEDILPF